MLAGSDGYTITSEPEAERFNEVMSSHPAAWSPRDMDPEPIRPGETLLLEPCVGEHYAARHGKPCPRVDLWPENAAAARLVMCALPEHTRPLLPRIVDAVTADMEPEDAQRSLLDAVEVLQGPVIGGWMRQQISEAGK